MPRKSEADKTIEYIVDGFRIIVVTAICIYASYEIIKILAGDLPAWIGSILFGLFVLYVSAAKSKIRDFFKK